jgi:hypothetical protein
MRDTCPANLIFADLIILMFGEEYKLLLFKMYACASYTSYNMKTNDITNTFLRDPVN